MPKTRVNCPNCRQPIMADINQLFDVNEDPEAKQRLLSGAYNMVQCPTCGYQGNIATPIVYHDPDKELLLTYYPPELNIPVNEQERMIGPLITQAVNRLPQEKRKGYLFRPQTMLTMQGLAERILEADGITKEMIQGQQKRLNLIQRLIEITSDDVFTEAAQQEDALIDQEFFGMLNRLVESAMMGGDEQSARRLSEMQRKLLPITTAGRKIAEQSKEVEAAVKAIQEAGASLTRESLLQMFLDAPSEIRVDVMASLARPALDYEFFRILSDRLENASGEERDQLAKLRDRLLEVTREIDRQMEERSKQARQALNELLKAPDIQEATQQNLEMIDEFFVRVLNEEMETARKNSDLERIQKLQQVGAVLQQASQPPEEVMLIEELLEAPDEQARRKWLEENKESVTPELTEALTGLLAQVQASQDKEMLARMQAVYRSVVKFSMEQNLKK